MPEIRLSIELISSLSCAVPEIQIRTLSPEDEFLVMACDGLWDVWSSDRVIEKARINLQENNNNPQICAEYLVRPSL